MLEPLAKKNVQKLIDACRRRWIALPIMATSLRTKTKRIGASASGRQSGRPAYSRKEEDRLVRGRVFL